MNPRPPPCSRIGPMALALSALLLAAPVQAEVVLDTFGPNESAPGRKLAVSDTAIARQSVAVSFNLASAATIHDILTSIQGDDTYQLGIVAGAGLQSGAFAYSTTLTNPTANALISGLGWALQAGSYWLVAKPDSGSVGTWQGGGQTGTRPWAYTQSSGLWVSGGNNDAPAARITVSAIPEPGSWAMMCGGLLLVGALVKRRVG